MATRKTETKRGDLPKSKLIWRGFQLLIVFAVAMLLCLVCVSEYSVAWHALHGNSIAYEGWRIRIPKKFYERDFDDKPAFWNLSFGIPLWNAPYAHISVFRVSARQQPFSYKEDYEKFSRGVTAVAEQKGYTFWEKKVVPVASTSSAYCLEFYSPGTKTQALSRCALENSRLIFYFEGDQKYLSDFIAMLGAMSPESGRPE